LSGRADPAERQRINLKTSLPDSLRGWGFAQRAHRKRRIEKENTHKRKKRQATTAGQELLRGLLGIDAEECSKLVGRVAAAGSSDAALFASLEASHLGAYARTMGMSREERDDRLHIVSSSIPIQRAIQAAFLSAEALCKGPRMAARAAARRELSPEKLLASENPSRSSSTSVPEAAQILKLTSSSCRTTRLLQDWPKPFARGVGERMSLLHLPSQLVPGDVLLHLTVAESLQTAIFCRAFREVVLEQAPSRLQDVGIDDFTRAARERTSGSRTLRSRQHPTSQRAAEAFMQCLRAPSLLPHFRRVDLRGVPPKMLADKLVIGALRRIPHLSTIVVEDSEWKSPADFKIWLRSLQLRPGVQFEMER